MGWHFLDDRRVLYELIYSAICRRDTGAVVPNLKDFIEFFGVEDVNRPIDLIYGKKYECTLYRLRDRNIRWKEENGFLEVLREKFTTYETLTKNSGSSGMFMIFNKIYKDTYKIELIDKSSNKEERCIFLRSMLNPSEKGKRTMPKGNMNPRKTEVERDEYDRCCEVAEWVLDNAEGKCEYCGKDAPFTKPGGIMYLEIHHVIWLSKDGPDIPENTIAVCPNCHRELHYGENKEQMVKDLYEKIDRLERE